MRGLRPHYDLAQILGQELGFGALLLRQMPRQEDRRQNTTLVDSYEPARTVN